MKKFLFSILISLSIAPLLYAYPKSPKTDLTPEQTRSTTYLKKYMADFGSLVAGMEILHIKEKNPDWEAINLTLRDMEDTLYLMRQADKEGNYKEFTDVLYQNLREVQAYSEKKDKRVYDAFEKMTNTCFKCHAQHRPSDFLVPKEKGPRVSETTTSFLFPQ